MSAICAASAGADSPSDPGVAIARTVHGRRGRWGRRRLAYAHVSVGARERQEEGPEHVALGREAGQVVETVVGRLPLKQRLAFVQRKVHGLDYEEIGQGLRCSAESARAHVFQALKKIRQALDGTAKEPRA